MFVKTKFTRFIGVAAAAVCLASGLNFTPFTLEVDAAETLTAFEITEEMQLGWNLGNTFDAYMSDLNGEIYPSYGLEAETCWGNPRTTTQMIDAVKAKGFKTIRIPVSWFQHVDNNNNYKIDEAWLARVKKIVDYCYQSGLYIILNVHHEEVWANRPDLGTAYDTIKPFFTSVWSQIASTFADYDQHLVFECMNEPRAKGTDHEWWGPTQAECDTINKLNADIVNVIRNTWSPYSDTRLIMLPGYCASSDATIMSKTVFPEGDDYLAASVHAYTPYDFTMNNEVQDHSQFTAKYANELKGCLEGIRNTFITNDIPVVIGEFSSSNYNNLEARVEWAETYATTAKAYGFPCVLWDNNVIVNEENPGEGHGYLDRASCSWYPQSEPVVDKLLEVYNDPSKPWAGEAKPPEIEHVDISTGTKIYQGPADLDASKDTAETGYQNSVGIDIEWAVLDGKDVAVKFTGSVPAVAVSDASWGGWTEVNAYDVDKEKGIAYYSMDKLKDAWTGDVNDIAHFSIRTNDLTTVDSAYAIKAADASNIPEDNTKKFNLDLSSRDNQSQVLFVIFKGAPGSAIEGCVGYMGAEWTNIEYKGTIDSDGTFAVCIPLYDTAENGIPSSVTSAQAQIWWCDDENATMSEYYIVGSGVPEPTTEATTEPATAPAPTEPSTVPVTTTPGSDQKIQEFTDVITEIGHDFVTFKTKGKFTVSRSEDIDKFREIGTDKTVKVNFLDYKDTTIMVLNQIEVVETAKTLYGDANLDGKVTMADATAILQHIGNQEKYGLEAQGMINADVVGNGDGITGEDALVVQMVDAKLLLQTYLPISAVPAQPQN